MRRRGLNANSHFANYSSGPVSGLVAFVTDRILVFALKVQSLFPCAGIDPEVSYSDTGISNCKTTNTDHQHGRIERKPLEGRLFTSQKI